MIRLSPRQLVALVIFTAGVLWAETPAIRGLLHMWNNSPMYSYGYLVPFISAFLVWSQREALARLTPTPSLVGGGAVLALWLLMMGLGRLGGVLLVEQLALLVAIAGGILVIGGWAYLKTMWAAVAYLLLMVPLWDGFTEPLHLKFQLLSASIGVRMLDLVGVPAWRVGTVIALPNLTIEVARACSGVNYLIAVLALGLPLAYLYLRSPWRRIVLIASAMVIAALSNSLRVALIGILAYLELGAPLHGPAHTLHGLFVSAIGHVALFVGLWLLSRHDKPAPNQPASEAAATVASSVVTPRLSPTAAFAPMAAAAIFVWAGAVAVNAYAPSPVPLAASLDQLPGSLGPFSADPYTAPPQPEWWSPADQELRRRYRQGELNVDVLIGYYEAQRQSREVVNYRSNALHRDSRAASLDLGSSGSIPINLAREKIGPYERLTVYWYEIDGQVETAPLAAKLRTLWNAVGTGRTNGAIVCLTTQSETAGTDPATLEALLTLARETHRALARCLPRRAPTADAAAPVSRKAPAA